MSQRQPTSGRKASKPFDSKRAWEYLLFILARRQYTVAQLKERLIKRGLPAEEAEPLLQRLLELRLVNDELYAEQYVHSRKSSRGRLSLRRELSQKGVDEELVQQQLSELSPAQQADAATALLLRNAWRYQPPGGDDDAGKGGSPVALPYAGAASRPGAKSTITTEETEFLARELRYKARTKAFAFLARRGFAADAAAAAIERTGWFDDR